MNGVISAGHPATAAVGAEILQQGGNAVDAAVAASFASFVAEAVLVNIGGGGIAQIYNPITQQATVYDFFSPMPGLGLAHRPETLDFRQILIDFGAVQQPFYIGRGSVAVPGVVAGLCQMAAEHGRLSLAQLLAPAIRLAQEGTPLTPALDFVARLLTPILTDTPELARLYQPHGHMITTGERMTLPDLAQTLTQLGHHGPKLFYHGTVAQAIVADQQAHGGLITADDLANYEVFKLAPIEVTYRDYTILLPPPSSTGGVLIALALHLLAAFPVSTMPHQSAAHLRLLIEVMRLVNICRAEWDSLSAGLNPLEMGAALTQFLAPTKIAQHVITLQQIINGQTPPLEPNHTPGPSNTTHLSVADESGMLVTVTTSAGENAGFVVGDTGIMLNNMLGELDLHPQGFHQLPAGQRLTTMMSPVIVLRNNQPILAVGSGGSNRIRSAILQFLSNVLDFNLPLSAAVEAPRLHFEANLTQLEGGIRPEVAQQLQQMGYDVHLWTERNMFFGGTHAVARNDQGQWEAAGDPRRGGSVEAIRN